MTFTREDALNFTKTAFAISTGRIREDLGDALAVANALAAFECLPELVAAGLLQAPRQDMTDRGDYHALLEHTQRLNDGDPVDYAKGLDADDLDILANCAESFFTELVKDPDTIPMPQKAKLEIIKTMATGKLKH
jgi:hypothetical protein